MLASTGQIRRQDALDVYRMVIMPHFVGDIVHSKFTYWHEAPIGLFVPCIPQKPSHKCKCYVGKHVFPLPFAANSARNTDGQSGPEMNYFHGLKKQVFGWLGRLPARAREGFWGSEGWGTLVISFLPPRIHVDMCAALLLTEEN
jgi:hypothetical protein